MDEWHVKERSMVANEIGQLSGRGRCYPPRVKESFDLLILLLWGERFRRELETFSCCCYWTDSDWTWWFYSRVTGMHSRRRRRVSTWARWNDSLNFNESKRGWTENDCGGWGRVVGVICVVSLDLGQLVGCRHCRYKCFLAINNLCSALGMFLSR